MRYSVIRSVVQSILVKFSHPSAVARGCAAQCGGAIPAQPVLTTKTEIRATPHADTNSFTAALAAGPALPPSSVTAKWTALGVSAAKSQSGSGWLNFAE